ncbi:MAG: transglycosylase SLT domain-containing protein [Deltaproteobacteria bacterium]|nr:transglycosylase SLT domain-containing protein [Deltaproteobacteria bacterium]
MTRLRPIIPSRVRKRRRLIARRVIMVLSLCLVGLLLWSNTETTAPHAALAQATSIVMRETGTSRESLERAEALLNIAARDSGLKDWANVLLGATFEKKLEKDRAIAAYRAVGKGGAASLDARVALLRLQSEPTLVSDLVALEDDLRTARRSDLVPAVQIERARLLLSVEDMRPAILLLQSMRREFPRSPLQTRARELVAETRASLPAEDPLVSREAMISEAEILLAAGEHADALSTIDTVIERFDALEVGRFRAMTIREQALRKLGRADQADDALLTVSASSGIENAGPALLQVARSAWNINDHHRALEFLAKLHERFPKSPNRDEAQYVEGRILEEMSALADAKELYLEIAKSASNEEYRLLARRRIAWLYLTNVDYSRAAEQFGLYRAQLGEALRTSAPTLQAFRSRVTFESAELSILRKYTELLEDRFHATYWLATALSAIPPEQRPKDAPDPVRLYSELAAEQPRGYYGMLARDELRKRSVAIAKTAATQVSPCSFPLPEGLRTRLKPFSGKQELATFSAREIDYAFRRVVSSAESGDTTLPYSVGTTRAQLFLESLNAARSVEIAEFLLRRLEVVDAQSPEIRCREALVQLSYPSPYLGTFVSAAEAHKVPPSLLLAIARTESYFNPEAVSRTGAQGLVQLMPPTASMEGWDGKSSLFDVSVNLPIGAKHLARLIRDYENRRPFAIAAYNAGSAAVDRWRIRYPKIDDRMWTELIGYPETNKYVKRVLAAEEVFRMIAPERPRD